MSVFEGVKQIVSEQLNVGEETITLESDFVNDLGADSLDVVEVVMALEDKFDVEIPDDKAESIVSVSDAVTYIESVQ